MNKGINICIRIDEKLNTKIEFECKKQRRNRSNLINLIIEDYFKEQSK